MRGIDKKFLISQTRLLAIVIALLLPVASKTTSATATNLPSHSRAQVLQGGVSQNTLIDNLERLGIQCVVQEGTPIKILVDQVRMGSRAYYGGIAKGDIIKELKQANADEDISGSMNEVDGTGSLSKFQWCHEQISHLAEMLAPYNKTFTITTFNRTFQTVQNCTPEKIEQIYSTIQPNGGTDLVDPLMERLGAARARHSAGGKPVVIAVITDGEPNIPRDPKVVNQALIKFTQSLSAPDQVSVTFLQIGDTFDGRGFCIDLDDNLVNEGARYDIVDTKTFDELKSQGLVNALIDAVIEAKKNRLLTGEQKHLKRFTKGLPPAGAAVNEAANQLEKLQGQRKEIERQLLGH
jgi:hypothetical protein